MSKEAKLRHFIIQLGLVMLRLYSKIERKHAKSDPFLDVKTDKNAQKSVFDIEAHYNQSTDGI